MKKKMIYALISILLWLGFRLSIPMISPQPELGYDGERFIHEPDSPNWQSSTTGKDTHFTEALELCEEQVLKELMKNHFGAKLVKEEEGAYLHFTVKTLLCGYIDDVQFLRIADKIHVQSSSRLGHSDLGANKKRIEKIRFLINSHLGEK